MPRARLLTAALLLALLFTGLGRLPLLDPDEGRYARTSQEMMEREDLVVPWFNGEPRLKKPVLFHWLQIGAFSLLGFSETAARLPSALAAAGTLLWLYLFARRRLGEGAALAACGILATTPLFFAMARAATTDMTLTFFTFGAAASLYAGIVEPGRRYRELILGGICLGLGMLAKGPVVLLVPALVLAAGTIARRRAPITVAGRTAATAGVMLAVAIPWVLLLFAEIGSKQVLEIWGRESLQRVATGLDHPESPFYFLLTVPVTFFPWSVLLPWASIRAVRTLKRGDGLPAILLAWTLGGFLFFSLGSGKLDSYLLPLAPGAALLLASALKPDAERQAATRQGAWLMAAMACAYLLTLPMERFVGDAPGLLPSVALGVGIFALVTASLAWRGRGRVLQPVLAGMIGLTLLAGVMTVPLAWAERKSTGPLVERAGLREAPGPLYVLRVRPPGAGFYARKIVKRVPARYLLIRMLEGEGAASVILENGRSDVIRQLLERGFREASRGGGLIAMRRDGPVD